MRKIFIIGLIFVSLLLSGCGNFDENIDENKNDIKLNGGQESYYGKFKLELDTPNNYPSIEDLILAIHERIYYYNHKRIHTTLKMPPRTFVSLLKEKEEEQEQEKEAASKTLQSEKGELNSSSSLSQESLFVFAQETGELTSTPVNK